MDSNILELINMNKWEEAFKKLNNDNKLFDQITNGKNLFHYACMRGNSKIIDRYLNIESNKIYLSDNDGNTGFHLLAINDWDNILLERIEKYPNFLKLKNYYDDFLYNIVLNKFNTLKIIIKLMKKFNYNKYLNHVNDSTGTTIILDVIDLCSQGDETSKKYFEILKLFHKMKLDFSIPVSHPPLFYTIMNDYVDVAKYMLQKLKVNVNILTNKQYTPLILCLQNKLEELTLMILNLNPNVNYSGMENKYVPLSLSFKYGLLTVAKELLKIQEIDLNKKDIYLNTPIYYLIKYIASKKHNLDKNVMSDWKNILEYMIDKCDLQNLNIENETPFHLLVKYKMWEQFKEKLSEKKLNINLVNKDGSTPLTYLRSEELPELINFVEKSIQNKSMPEMKENDILLPSVNTDDGYFGLFNSDGIHNIIYLINLLKKYDNLQVPVQLPLYDKIMWDKYKVILHGSYDDPLTTLMYSLVTTYFDTFYTILPCMIFWKDRDLNFFTQDKLYLERAIHDAKRFVLLRVTIIVTKSVLHANVVIYDKKLNKLIRFEPYGDWEFHDSYSLDKLIMDMFLNVLDKKSQKTLKYIRPNEYLDKTKFQTTSLGDHPSEKNLGDPMGYCLAWCFWFTELKLLNPDVGEGKLVSNALNKIIKTDSSNRNPLLTYIRAYSKQLDKEKNKYLESVGINRNEIYKISYTSEKLDLIKNSSEKYVVDRLLNKNV